jgi:hypothetical protein
MTQREGEQDAVSGKSIQAQMVEAHQRQIARAEQAEATLARYKALAEELLTWWDGDLVMTAKSIVDKARKLRSEDAS